MTMTSRSVATSIGIDDDLTNDCRALRAQRRAQRWSFADDIARLLVLTEANELRMPQVVVDSPLEELELMAKLVETYFLGS